MDRPGLQRILDTLPDTRIAVIGDFFLDRYLIIDSSLAETSIETGRTAHQVVEKRLAPGAAGTVVANLRALGVGEVICIGVVGADGEGYELRRALRRTGANYSTWLTERRDRVTPCYTKPMLRENGVETELDRIDTKNRAELSADIEDELLGRLGAVISEAHAVVIADQVQERNYGAITDRVRSALADTAQRHPGKVFLADSRVRIGEFRNVMVKPNKFETVDAARGNARPDRSGAREVSPDEARACLQELRERTGRPVFMTAQEQGIFICDETITNVPAVRVEGEIDPVGAGDSCTAGIVTALCAGAGLEDAALMGNLVASITVQKIGETGTASPAEVLARWDQYERGAK